MSTLVHILRAPSCVTYDEKAILDSLDKYERRYLKRFVCGWCEKSLDVSGCHIIQFTPEDKPCPQRVRVERLENCLAEYKPRLTRRKKK